LIKNDSVQRSNNKASVAGRVCCVEFCQHYLEDLKVRLCRGSGRRLQRRAPCGLKR
jgi:hypothetical protein